MAYIKEWREYYFIIQLDGCIYSFGRDDNFMMIIVFSIKLVNNKFVDNLVLCLVLNFYSHRPCGLRIIVVKNLYDLY